MVGGSWSDVTGAMLPRIWQGGITRLITPLITTHEPPSSCDFGVSALTLGRYRRGIESRRVWV